MKPPLRIVGIALSIVFGLQVGCGRPESLRARAEKGDANAQLQLGFRYYRGEGVPEDHVEAAKWYRQAADRGFAPAQHNLGLMYAKGQGVPRDDVEAVLWNRRAADQGLAKGEGVPQDYVEAYKWLTIAARGGLAKAEQYQRTVALEMSAAQVAEALRRSREFQLKKNTAEVDRGEAQ